MATIEDRRWKTDRATGKRVRTDYTGSEPYRIRWREYPNAPTQKSESFARKVDAQDRLAALEHSLRAGTYVDPAAGRITFAELWASWHGDRTDLESSSADRIDIYWRHQIKPTLGHVPIAAIDRELLRGWVRQMGADKVAPRSVRKVAYLVSQALEVAVEDRRIATNPAHKLRGLPKVGPSSAQFCTAEEIARLVAATDERFQALVLTASWTGLRIGELAGLRRRSVDLMRRRVDVVESITEERGKVIHKKYGKTGAARRSVPLTKHVTEVLAGHVARLGPDDLVFTSAEGTPLRRSNLHVKVWQPAVIAVGLGERVPAPLPGKPKRTLYEGLRFHDLRHTAISLWISRGADYTQLMRWAGHESVVTLIDTYGHLMPDREAEVIDALDELAAVSAAAVEPATVTPIDRSEAAG